MLTWFCDPARFPFNTALCNVPPSAAFLWLEHCCSLAFTTPCVLHFSLTSDFFTLFTAFLSELSWKHIIHVLGKDIGSFACFKMQEQKLLASEGKVSKSKLSPRSKGTVEGQILTWSFLWTRCLAKLKVHIQEKIMDQVTHERPLPLTDSYSTISGWERDWWHSWENWIVFTISLPSSYVDRKRTTQKSRTLTCIRRCCHVEEALMYMDGLGKEPLAVCGKLQVLLWHPQRAWGWQRPEHVCVFGV